MTKGHPLPDHASGPLDACTPPSDSVVELLREAGDALRKSQCHLRLELAAKNYYHFSEKLIARIEKALAHGAARVPEWRSIETAPRVEEWFAAYRPDAGVFPAIWLYPDHEDGGPDYEEEPCLFDAYGSDLTGEEPTHWTPLPDAGVLDMLLAQGMETGTAKTEGLGLKDDSPVGTMRPKTQGIQP